jgi:hypothetical protein
MVARLLSRIDSRRADKRASTFEIARADFGEAWLEFSSKRTPADFQACAIHPSLTGNNPQRDPFVCVAYKLENST